MLRFKKMYEGFAFELSTLSLNFCRDYPNKIINKYINILKKIFQKSIS